MTQLKTIRDTMRLIAATSAVLLATGAGSAFAHNFDGSNEITGAYSDNNSEFNVEQDTDLDVDNSSRIDNLLEADLNTGRNETSFNTVSGDAETGSVAVDVAVDNDTSDDSLGNWGDALAFGDVDADFENRLTGYSSANNNEVNVDQDNDVNISNESRIDNSVNVKANTGRNETIGNTEAGDQETGDVNVSADISNTTGGGSGVLGGLSLGGGDIDVSGGNAGTGAFSDNNNEVNVDQSNDIRISNDSRINNDINVDANTGHNTTNYNTLGGNSRTGDVDVNLSLTNRTQ